MIRYLWPGVEAEAAVDRLAVFGAGDVVLLVHRRQHLVAALQRRVRIEEGVVFGGRLGQAGDQRRFVQAQLFRRLAEVGLRRRLGPDRGLSFDRPVGRRVEVGGEDPFLRVGFLLLVGKVCFDQLSFQRLFGVLDVEVADQLLGDRRGTLDRLAAGEQVLPGGAGDPGRIERTVVEVVLVLDRDRGVPEALRQRPRGDRLADVFGVDEADQAAVGGVDRRGTALLHRFEAGERRRRLVDVDRPAGGDRGPDQAQAEQDPQGDRDLLPLRGVRPASPLARAACHSAANCREAGSLAHE